MELNTMGANGSAVPYFNDGMAQEMTFQTSAMGAETSAGGVRVNIIPKEGGNDFRGDTFFGTIPNRHFSSSNLDDNIIRRGLTTQPTVLMTREFNQSLGGPIAKDRLWFFAHIPVSAQQQLRGGRVLRGRTARPWTTTPSSRVSAA